LNVIDPHLALARDDRFYELGVELRERGPELLAAAHDPANWTLATVGAFALGACFVGAHRGMGPAADFAHRALFRRPGEVMLGYRSLGAFGTLPVYLPLRDRLTHLQIVAPTGQAKTSLMEWLAYQDLKSGLTVFCVETEGDLGGKLLPLASWLGRPIHYFDYASSLPTMKWNPLAGDPVDAAERAVTTFQSAVSSGDEKFFENFNSMFLRHSILAVCAHAEREHRIATMSDLDRFAQSEKHRNRVLEVERNRSGSRFTVNAKNLPRRTRGYWQDLYYGQYGKRERTQFVAGLHAVLDGLLGQRVVERALTPEEGEPVLDMAEALDSGGLVLVSVPQGAAEATSRVLSIWMMEYFRQTVLARGDGGFPVACYLDEVHTMLGHANSDAALAFSRLVTQGRRRHVGFNLAYQSFSLLPEPLKDALDSNARNKLVSGGLQGSDADEALRMMGYTEDEVRDYRRTHKGLLGGPGTFSVGRRRQRRSRVSEDELQYLPRGHWHASLVKRGRLQPPLVIRAGRAPRPPRAHREAFVGASHREQSREEVGVA
jgi:hypothetical protein